MNQIHPLAVVDPEAKLGDNNIIGPFCVIDKNVVMGDNNHLLNNVTIHTGARIGSGKTTTLFVRTSPSAVVLPVVARPLSAQETC